MGNKIQRSKKAPNLEAVLQEGTDKTMGYVIYSTPTEGYCITQGLKSFDSGNNLGLLCITNVTIIHQANTLARLEIPIKDIINVKLRLCQMNYMTYPNDEVVSLKCKLDETIVSVNFKVDNPDTTFEEIEKARKNYSAMSQRKLSQKSFKVNI